MNVTIKNTGDLNAMLSVEIKPEDYQGKVDKQLTDYRKRANIPGFRPGHVPASLVKKQYGKAILIEEVNQILQQAVYNHIQEEKIDILGNPLPVLQEDIDWDSQTEFVFDFELGLAPEFELAINKKTKVDYLKIVADEKMVERYASDYAKRFGTMSYPESIEKDSIVKAQFAELDGEGNKVEEGVNSEATFTMESVEDKKSIKALTGKKIKDVVVIDAKKAFKADFNLSGLLKVTPEQIEASTGSFELTIEEVSKLDGAEMNQELFDKVFGEGTVNGKEEFYAKVKEDAERMFIGESERKFYDDVRQVVLKKAKFELPDEFLKKWLQTSGENPIPADEVEQQYGDMRDSMKWQLVESKVVKDHNIEVTPEELTEFAKGLVAQQMAQYGQMPEGMDLDAIAKNVLGNKEEAQRITEQLFTEKLVKFFKENLKLNEKEVSFDDFIKEATKK
jgi:trigger factor